MSDTETDDTIDIRIRPIAEHEHAMVFSDFSRSLRQSPSSAGCESPALYRAASTIVDRLLSGTDRWTVLVAESVDVADECAGWIASRPTAHGVQLAGVYVKHAYRGYGVARRLLAAAGIAKGVEFKVVFGAPAQHREARARGYRPQFTPFVVFDLLAQAEKGAP